MEGGSNGGAVAILDFRVGVVGRVFRVASRYKVPNRSPRTSDKFCQRKETSKKRNKFALVRDRTRDLVSRAVAILDFDVGLVLSVFRVALRRQVPKGIPLVKRKAGKGKETSKKRKKFALVRDRTRDLVSRVVAILDVDVGLVLGVFRIASRRQVPKGIPLVKRNAGKGKETRKKREKVALVGDRTRDPKQDTVVESMLFIKHPV